MKDELMGERTIAMGPAAATIRRSTAAESTNTAAACSTLQRPFVVMAESSMIRWGRFGSIRSWQEVLVRQSISRIYQRTRSYTRSQLNQFEFRTDDRCTYVRTFERTFVSFVFISLHSIPYLSVLWSQQYSLLCPMNYMRIQQIISCMCLCGIFDHLHVIPPYDSTVTMNSSSQYVSVSFPVPDRIR